MNFKRWDEDPRQYEDRLNPGASNCSRDPSDYRFGLTEAEIVNFVRLADLYRALTLLQYGSSKLYPYLMKRVDVFPIMLRDLPFHSLFRGGTEGGLRTHYVHQCLYFGHSSRGGGWKSQNPILTLFTWYYRFLQRRIEKCPPAVKEAYDLFVKRKFEEQGLDYITEMKEIECPSTHPNQGSNSESSSNHLVEPTEMQPAQEQPHPATASVSVTQPHQDSILQNRSAECSNESPEEAAYYKRGDKVFIEKDRKATRAMVCEITPQKSA